MARTRFWTGAVSVALLTLIGGSAAQDAGSPATIALPSPALDSDRSLEKAMADRRSVRSFADAPLALAEISQLLWAAQGENRANGRRTAPSAGALYPLEVFCVVGNASDLDAGVYRYRPDGHAAVPVLEGDRRSELAAATRQRWIASAPVTIVIAGVYERTEKKYGDRAERYVHIEVGAAMENLCLQATALGLGTTPVGPLMMTRSGPCAAWPRTSGRSSSCPSGESSKLKRMTSDPHARPDMDEYFMGIAMAVRKRANCAGNRVGAVIVRDKHIVSTGYNGTPHDMTNCMDGGCHRCSHRDEYPSGAGYDLCICVHAEQNAILAAARFGIAIEGATMYSTMRPCFGCTKELLQAGVARVFYLHDWSHPDKAKNAEYERLQARFPGGIRRLDMDDPDAEWAVSALRKKAEQAVAVPDELGHASA